MQRLNQVIFVIALLSLCWFAMMAFHEFGHVLGAVLSGGTVERVVLHPLTISRTDVTPNPNPLTVVWLGPIVGCVLPLVAAALVSKRLAFARNTVMFFAGFCLLANGAYIAVGAMDKVGDCGEMLKHGSPIWTLLLFGAVTIPAGLYIWHRIGSVKEFLADANAIDAKTAWSFLLAAAVVFGIAFFCFADNAMIGKP